MNHHLALEAPTASFADIRAALVCLRQKTKTTREKEKYCRLDRMYAHEYLWGNNGWKLRVSEFLRYLQHRNEPAVYLDLCGRAIGNTLGSTHNYSYSIQPVRDGLRRVHEVRACGDIFSLRDLDTFLKYIYANGHLLGFVTFVPDTGLKAYSPWNNPPVPQPRLYRDVVYRILERQLRAVISILRPGGFILLNAPFPLSTAKDFLQGKLACDGEMAQWVRPIVRSMHCKFEVHSSITGPQILICKPPK